MTTSTLYDLTRIAALPTRGGFGASPQFESMPLAAQPELLFLMAARARTDEEMREAMARDRVRADMDRDATALLDKA